MPIHPLPKFNIDDHGNTLLLQRSYTPTAHGTGPGVARYKCPPSQRSFRRRVAISREKRSFSPKANPRTVLSAIAQQEEPRQLRRASSVPLMPAVTDHIYRDGAGNVRHLNKEGYFLDRPPPIALTEADKARSSRVAMRWMPLPPASLRVATPSAGGIHLAPPRSRPGTSLEDHLEERRRQLGNPLPTKEGTRTSQMGITRHPSRERNRPPPAPS